MSEEASSAAAADLAAQADPPHRGCVPPVWAAAAALGLIGIADWLFYGHPVGWTLGAFGAVVATFVAGTHIDVLRRLAAGLALALALLACAAAVVEPSALAVMMFLGCMLSIQASGRGSGRGAVGQLIGMTLAAASGVVQGIVDALRLPGWMVASVGGTAAQALLRSWALPVVAGGVFLLLFASANPLIDAILLRFDFERAILDLLPSTSRVMFWGFIGGVVWWLVRARLSEVMDHTPQRTGLLPSANAWGEQTLVDYFFSEPAIIRSMLLFNGMFALQNSMDVAYLWGYAALPPGFTFASYAHRGAYPLMATVLLAAAFVLIAFRAGAPSEHAKGARALMYLWVAQNVVLVASSIWRMVLYVEVYSLTYARVAALVWMGLVALGLVLIVLRFAAGRSNTWLVNANAVVLGATLYAAAFADIGGFIASTNVRHAREVGGQGVQLDLAYVERIGPAALPALDRYCRALQERAALEGDSVAARLNGIERHARRVEEKLSVEVRRREADWRGRSGLTNRIADLGQSCRSSF